MSIHLPSLPFSLVKLPGLRELWPGHAAGVGSSLEGPRPTAPSSCQAAGEVSPGTLPVGCPSPGSESGRAFAPNIQEDTLGHDESGAWHGPGRHSHPKRGLSTCQLRTEELLLVVRCPFPLEANTPHVGVPASRLAIPGRDRVPAAVHPAARVQGQQLAKDTGGATSTVLNRKPKGSSEVPLPGSFQASSFSTLLARASSFEEGSATNSGSNTAPAKRSFNAALAKRNSPALAAADLCFQRLRAQHVAISMCNGKTGQRVP